MSNVVSITVQARDMTRDAFDAVNRSARNIATNIGTMFTRIGSGFQQLGNHARGLSTHMGTVFTRIGDGVRDVGNNVRGFATNIGGLLTRVASGFGPINQQSRNLSSSIGSLFSTLGNGVRNVGTRSQGLTSTLGSGFRRLGELASDAGDKILEIGKTIGTFASDNKTQIALVGAALTALPLIASTAAVAITLGLGGAIAGIGIMAAKQNDQVKKAFSELKDSVSDDLDAMVQPFVPALIRIADIFKNTFDSLSPSLTRAFEKMAPAVEGFVADLARGFESFGVTVAVLADRFGPLMEVLGSELQVLLEHLSQSFAQLALAADPEFVSLLISSLTALTDVIMYTIINLAKLGSGITNLIDLIPGINFEDGEASSRSFGEAVGETTQNLLGAGEATGGLTSKMAELANQFLAASDAEIGFEAAIDNATKAIQKNGRTLDINSEKGRDNRQALNSIASSALRMRDSMEEAGQDSSEAMSRARRQFIRAAEGMGLSRSEARKLADQSGLLASAVRKVPSRKRTTFSSNAPSVKGQVDSLAASLGSIARNIVIDIATRTAAGKATGGVIGAATGGARGNMVMVGEAGRELVRLPYGSQVIPNGQTERMMSGGGGGGSAPFIVQLRLGTADLGEILIDPLRKAVQTRGGNVQAAIGR